MLATVTYVSWSNDLPYILNTIWWLNVILWENASVWPDLWPPNKCRTQWSIFHDPVTLPNILKTIWWMNVFLIRCQHDTTLIELIIDVGAVSWGLFRWWTSYFRILGQCETQPLMVAWLEAHPLGMQAAPSSIPTSGTFFLGDLVMKKFLRPFSLFHWFKKSSCQLLAKECALSTGKLHRRLAQEQCC